MDDFLSVFGVYDFAVRDALVLSLVALAIYVLLSAGVFAVPQVGLMAVGAYVSAILSVDYGLAPLLAVLAGSVAAALVGFLLAAILSRLDGIYLAIGSIAFSEVVRVAVLNLPLTGGAQGKVGIPREATDLWICGAVALAAVGLVALRRSRVGLAMAGMRVDTLMTRHQGIDTNRLRTALFGVSGLLAGCAGGLHVHMSGFVDPGQFDFELLTQLLAVVVIGGMTYVAGSFVGAAVIFGLPFTLEAFAEYQVLVNGAIIVAVVAFAPGGLLDVVRRVTSTLRSPGPPPLELAQPVPDHARETPARRAKGEAVLHAEGVRVTFGGVHAVDDVSVEVAAGEILGVIGPNGSGKTTLLNALSGAYRPSAGRGTVAGIRLDRLWGRPDRLARAGIARTFQTIRLMESASAATNVALGVPRADAARRNTLARELLDQLGLGSVARRPVTSLSYGLRREVEIARALARRPKLLLLDEPTAGMTPVERESVFRVVARARDEGMAIVLVEHDVAMMRRFCDRLVVLDFGRVLAQGEPDEVLSSKEVIDAYIGSGALA